MKNKSLTFETHPSLIEVDYVSSDVVRVQIHGDMAVSVEFDNDVMLATKGNFTIATEGELSLISKENPICLDSIDSEIYLNSRQSKMIKDSKESIEYIEQKQLEQKKEFRMATKSELEQQKLIDRITVLENLIKGMKCQE